MDTVSELRPGDDGFDGFRMRLPEDCVEYMLFVIGDKAETSLPSLEAIRKAANQKLDELAKDYIWQREPFRLETKIQKGLKLPYLHGSTHYGDNVEDEWLIVFLLRELSKSFPSLWVRLSDSDGEFLLIEAAKVTPKWLTPENDAHRVWIQDGKLWIIPPRTRSSSSVRAADPTTSRPLSLAEAVETIRASPSALIHSPLVEAEAFYRLDKYPAQIAASFHHSLITLPRKLAYVLHARPQSVAPATEAFYLRDPRSLKPVLSSPSASSSPPLIFPPADLVTVSVRFTKVLYAQLKSQHFPPPPAWRSLLLQAAEAGTDTEGGLPRGRPDATKVPGALSKKKKLACLEMGMKLTTGFELLARTGLHESASRVVREVGLLLDDLAEDGGDEALPTDEEIRGWPEVGRDDDDSWMDIDFRDFEKALDGKGSGRGGTASATKRGGAGEEAGAGFGDATAQADLQRIVSRFEAFLNDESAGIEGAEIDEMDQDNDSDEDDEECDDDGDDDEDEDKEVSFDEEQFSRMMREMMGLPAEDESGKGKGTDSSTLAEAKEAEDEEVKIDEDDEDDEDEEIRRIMQQMESELRGHGALELDPKPKASSARIKEKEGEKPTAGPVEPNGEDHGDESGGGSSDEEVDIDYNLAKNLLESFKSQAGMAGPAGNLLGLMGVTLPRDEEDSEDDQKGTNDP